LTSGGPPPYSTWVTWLSLPAPVILRYISASVRPFGQLALGALVQHGDDGADHFQVAQLLGGDVEQHVLAARIVFASAWVK
jgi:hypothetical protein